MTDLEINQRITQTIQKISKQRLDEKMRLFELIDLPFITITYKTEKEIVGKKRLRLYLELFELIYPLWANSDNETKSQFISNIFKCVCTIEDLEKLKTFKDITIKKVITVKNDNVKTIKRLRWRHRDNVHKNYIHFKG